MSARCILAAAALIAAPATAQDADELADRFERALVAGDYRVLPLTEDFTYTENGARLDPWDGMWRTLTAVEGAQDFPGLDYRVELAEDENTAVRLVEFEENTVHGVMAYRLEARNGEIASITMLPVREEFGGDRGGTLTLLQPMLPFTMDGELVGPADPAMQSDSSLSGDSIMRERIAAYFAGYSGDMNVVEAQFEYGLDFTDDCARFDNGQQATGAAESDVLDPAHPDFRPYALGCEAQLASGYYSRFDVGELSIVTDPARSLAIAFVRLDQPGTRLTFDAPGVGTVTYPGPRGAVEGADTGEQFDGRILTNMITPMSVNGAYVFKFQDGAIRRIDAFYRGAPLGWDGF